jgi:hypothetical protein
MRLVHCLLIDYLRKLGFRSPYATASFPACSPLKNVNRHLGNHYFYLTDIKNFYPSIKGKMIAQVICHLDKTAEEKQVIEFLRRYCLGRKGELLIGAPASPDLANLVAGILIDEQIGEYCKEFNLTYTRYLDDLAISSIEPIGKRKRKVIRFIVENAGFEINHQKSLVWDLREGPITITGVGLKLNKFGVQETFLDRSFLRKIKGAIYLARQGKVSKHLVYGLMSTFFGVTGPGNRTLNQTEKRLTNEYIAFRRYVKKLKL